MLLLVVGVVKKLGYQVGYLVGAFYEEYREGRAVYREEDRAKPLVEPTQDEQEWDDDEREWDDEDDGDRMTRAYD